MSSWRDEYLYKSRDTTRAAKDSEGVTRRPRHLSRSPDRREHRRRSRSRARARSRSPEKRRRSRSRSLSPRLKSLNRHKDYNDDRREISSRSRHDVVGSSSERYHRRPHSRSASTSSSSHEESMRHRSGFKHSSSPGGHRDKSPERRKKRSSRRERLERRSTITGKKIKMKAPRDGMEEARADLLKFLNSTH